MRGIRQALGAAALLAGLALSGGASAQDCPIKIGSIYPTSGPMGLVGERIANTTQFAVEVMNEAGGVKDCPVEILLRDTQGDPKVGVDAAKSLVDIEGVKVLLGAVSSGVSLPVLTSVAVPSKVVQISCCSSSPSFTALAQEGKTDGFWFRTYATSRTQAAVGAKVTMDQGYGKTAVIYVNTDFGVNAAEQYKLDVEKLGGSIVAMVPYAEKQQSYRAEVSKALESEPDSLYLVAFPVDGATITREWISLGGTKSLVVNNSLRSTDYLEAVGYEYLTDLVGYDASQPRGVEAVSEFDAMFQTKFDGPPDGPGLHSSFDAAIVALLAMEAADELTGEAIRDKIRAVTDPAGTEVGPTVEGLKKAKELLAAGETIRYVGATGPLQFDANGDVNAPKLIWKFNEEASEEIGYMSLEDIDALVQELDG